MAKSGRGPHLTPVSSGAHRRILPGGSSGRLPIIVLILVVVALLFVWRYHRTTAPVTGGRVFPNQPAH